MDQLEILPHEGEVSEAVAKWLRLRGFEVTVLPAGKQGFDITAVHPVNGQEWVIEAKGGSSSKVGSPGYGKNSYGQNGAYNGIAQAFWMASHWTSKDDFRDHNIGFAIPYAKYFNKHSEPLENACRLMGIAIFRVYPDLTVKIFPEELENIGNGRLKRPAELLGEKSSRAGA